MQRGDFATEYWMFFVFNIRRCALSCWLSAQNEMCLRRASNLDHRVSLSLTGKHVIHYLVTKTMRSESRFVTRKLRIAFMIFNFDVEVSFPRQAFLP